MKKKSLLELFIAVFTCMSCANIEFEDMQEFVMLDNTQVSNNLKTRTLIMASDLKADKILLAANGYDTTAIVERDSFYLVGTEWIFFKDRLRDIRVNMIKPRMSASHILPIESQRIYINAILLSGMNAKVSLQDAIEGWNNVGSCSINFTSNIFSDVQLGRSVITADIEENPSILTKNDLLRAEGPVEGYPGRIFYINTASPYWTNLGPTGETYAVMHAMGQCLGLKPISPQQATDHSIMLAVTGLKTDINQWKGFSNSDKEFLRKNYPLASPVFDMTCTPDASKKDGKLVLKANIEYTFTVNCNYAWCVNPIYEIECNPKTIGNYEFNKKSNNIFTVKFLTDGKFDLNITAIDNIDRTAIKFTQPILSYLNQIVIKAPNQMELGMDYDFRVSYSGELDVEPQYEISVTEKYFGNVNESASVVNVSNGHAKVKFNDYGAYILTAKIANKASITPRRFFFTKLYRPKCTCNKYPNNSKHYEAFFKEEFDSSILQPEGITYNIDFEPSSGFENRAIFNINLITLQNEWDLPKRINRSFITESIPWIVQKGDNTHFEYVRTSSIVYDTTSEHEHFYARMPWMCEVVYPEEDRCFLEF